MNRNKIIIRAKLKSFTNIFYVLLGIFFLVAFFGLLREHFSSIFLACDLLLGFIFFVCSVGKENHNFRKSFGLSKLVFLSSQNRNFGKNKNQNGHVLSKVGRTRIYMEDFKSSRKRKNQDSRLVF